jgi:Tfp pilus assembly protein PilF
LALAYLQDGRPRDALPLLEEALELTRARSGPDHPEAIALMDNLALARLRAGDAARAEPLLRRVLERQKQSGAPPAIIARTSAQLGVCLIKEGKAAEAEPLLRDCLAIREQTIPDEWPRFNAMSLLGGSLLGQNKYAEAEPLILRGYEGMKARAATIPVAAQYLLPEAAGRIIALYDAWGRPGQANDWRAKLGPAALEEKPEPAVSAARPGTKPK